MKKVILSSLCNLPLMLLCQWQGWTHAIYGNECRINEPTKKSHWQISPSIVSNPNCGDSGSEHSILLSPVFNEPNWLYIDLDFMVNNQGGSVCGYDAEYIEFRRNGVWTIYEDGLDYNTNTIQRYENDTQWRHLQIYTFGAPDFQIRLRYDTDKAFLGSFNHRFPPGLHLKNFKLLPTCDTVVVLAIGSDSIKTKPRPAMYDTMVNIFPNPAREYINIIPYQPFTLVNCHGRHIKKGAGKMSVAELTAGTYYVITEHEVLKLIKMQ